MLPDWPETKEEIRRAYLRALKTANDEKLGFLAKVPLVALHEGDSNSLSRADGSSSARPLDRISAELRMEESDVEALSLREMLAKVAALAEGMARGRSEHAFEAIGEAVSEAGTKVDAGGKPFNAELVLETWERMEILFDTRGRPRLPTIVLSPAMAEQANIELRRLHTDPDLRTRAEGILARKREAWLAREADRTLAG